MLNKQKKIGHKRPIYLLIGIIWAVTVCDKHVLNHGGSKFGG
jgi:hypothetical protein